MLTPDQLSKLRRFLELRDARDTTKVAAEQAEEDYRHAEAELWDNLDESAVKGGIKVDLGEPWGVVRFSPRETFYGRVLDSDAALDYFEQTAQVDEFTKPKIVAARVNELVRERIESGQPMPDGIDWYARRFVAITRTK